MQVTNRNIDEVGATHWLPLVQTAWTDITEEARVAPALDATHGGDATITALKGRNLREGVHRWQINSPSGASPTNNRPVGLSSALMFPPGSDFDKVSAHWNACPPVLKFTPTVDFSGRKHTACVADSEATWSINASKASNHRVCPHACRIRLPADRVAPALNLSGHSDPTGIARTCSDIHKLPDRWVALANMILSPTEDFAVEFNSANVVVAGCDFLEAPLITSCAGYVAIRTLVAKSSGKAGVSAFIAIQTCKAWFACATGRSSIISNTNVAVRTCKARRAVSIEAGIRRHHLSGVGHAGIHR